MKTRYLIPIGWPAFGPFLPISHPDDAGVFRGGVRHPASGRSSLLECLSWSLIGGDPDRVESQHCHGCNGDSYCDESFWSAWGQDFQFLR
jgi:hypothetical protein